MLFSTNERNRILRIYPFFQRLVRSYFPDESSVFGVLFLDVPHDVHATGPTKVAFGAQELFVLQFAIKMVLKVPVVGYGVVLAHGTTQQSVGRCSVRPVDGIILMLRVIFGFAVGHRVVLLQENATNVTQTRLVLLPQRFGYNRSCCWFRLITFLLRFVDPDKKKADSISMQTHKEKKLG